jgi:hypothetical protein
MNDNINMDSTPCYCTVHVYVVINDPAIVLSMFMLSFIDPAIVLSMFMLSFIDPHKHVQYNSRVNE